jgi:hypothetical protein
VDGTVLPGKNYYGCPVVLSLQSCPGNLVRHAICCLSRQSCSTCTCHLLSVPLCFSILDVLFWLSCPGCLVTAVLLRLSCPCGTVLTTLFWQSCFTCPPDSHSGCLVLAVCSSCPGPAVCFLIVHIAQAVLSLWSCPVCPDPPVLSVLFCLLFCLSCSTCPMLAVLFCLSCISCLVLPVLSSSPLLAVYRYIYSTVCI